MSRAQSCLAVLQSCCPADGAALCAPVQSVWELSALPVVTAHAQPPLLRSPLTPALPRLLQALREEIKSMHGLRIFTSTPKPAQ